MKRISLVFIVALLVEVSCVHNTYRRQDKINIEPKEVVAGSPVLIKYQKPVEIVKVGETIMKPVAIVNEPPPEKEMEDIERAFTNMVFDKKMGFGCRLM